MSGCSVDEDLIQELLIFQTIEQCQHCFDKPNKLVRLRPTDDLEASNNYLGECGVAKIDCFKSFMIMGYKMMVEVMKNDDSNEDS